MIKSNGGIIGPDNVTTGGAFGSASGVFKLGEVTDLIKDSKWPTAGPGGFQVANSCRFNSGSDDHLDKTFGQAGNRRTFTVSFWKKTTTKETYNAIFDAAQDGSNSDDLYFHTGRFNFSGYYGSTQFALRTTAKFRDPGAWAHFVVAFDTTQGTAANRIKMYVNGVQETAFDDETYPSQNFETTYMNTARLHNIGTLVNNDDFPLDGYLAEFCFIDGSALAPDQFGEFDSQTGIWVPKAVTGLTFGTNGFYLDFKDSSVLGNDVSGNNNDFAMRNLTSIDQSTDTCTTNFATLNPLMAGTSSLTYSEGNLKIVFGASGTWYFTTSTIAATQGKWYCEVKIDAVGGQTSVGIIPMETVAVQQNAASDYMGKESNSIGYVENGKLYKTNSVQETTSTYTTNDIIGIAFNLDDNSIQFYKNGSSVGSAISLTSGLTYVVGVSGYNSSTQSVNFGSPSFAISSGNTDGNGFGNFEYAVPTGYLSLNTKNLTTVLA